MTGGVLALVVVGGGVWWTTRTKKPQEMDKWVKRQHRLAKDVHRSGGGV
jgi:hypothetical protein